MRNFSLGSQTTWIFMEILKVLETTGLEGARVETT